jgi:hypothetical protein
MDVAIGCSISRIGMSGLKRTCRFSSGIKPLKIGILSDILWGRPPDSFNNDLIISAEPCDSAKKEPFQHDEQAYQEHADSDLVDGMHSCEVKIARPVGVLLPEIISQYLSYLEEIFESGVSGFRSLGHAFVVLGLISKTIHSLPAQSSYRLRG